MLFSLRLECDINYHEAVDEYHNTGPILGLGNELGIVKDSVVPGIVVHAMIFFGSIATLRS